MEEVRKLLLLKIVECWYTRPKKENWSENIIWWFSWGSVICAALAGNSISHINYYYDCRVNNVNERHTAHIRASDKIGNEVDMGLKEASSHAPTPRRIHDVLGKMKYNEVMKKFRQIRMFEFHQLKSTQLRNIMMSSYPCVEFSHSCHLKQIRCIQFKRWMTKSFLKWNLLSTSTRERYVEAEKIELHFFVDEKERASVGGWISIACLPRLNRLLTFFRAFSSLHFSLPILERNEL